MTDDANSFITMGLGWLLTFLSITAHIFQVWDVRSHKGQNLWQKACNHSYLSLKQLTLALHNALVPWI